MVKIGKTSEGKINHVIIADRYLLMLDAQKKPSGFQAIIHMCVCTMCRSLIPQAKLKVVSNTEHWARDQTMVFGRWQVAVHTWTMNMGVRKWWIRHYFFSCDIFKCEQNLMLLEVTFSCDSVLFSLLFNLESRILINLIESHLISIDLLQSSLSPSQPVSSVSVCLSQLCSILFNLPQSRSILFNIIQSCSVSFSLPMSLYEKSYAMIWDAW